MAQPTRKRVLIVNRKPPHGTIYALESLEIALIAAAFDQDVSIAFVDDGVYQLVKNQDTRAIETRNFSPAYRALADHDVKTLYVERESLAARGLTPDDLLVPVEVLSATDMARCIAGHDVLLSA
jgi:tRNA 2-thiouridine synthesizing protein C